MVQDTEMEELLAESEPASRSLVDQAYSRIEEMIVLLQLKPGEVLSESELSEKIGIGRTPIREALQRLSREGMVIILPRRGVLVSEINPQKQLLVLEVRRVLEGLLARTAATRRSDEEAGRFRRIAEAMERAAKDNDGVVFMRLDRMFHRLLEQSAHNEYAARAMKLFDGLSRRFWYRHYKEAWDLPITAQLHAGLAREIADGDPEGAEGASDRLVDYVFEVTYASVRSFLEEGRPFSR